MSFLRKVFFLVKKDLTSEFRTKETFSAMLIFAFLVLAIFSFAFDPTQETLREVFPGLIWVAITYTGILCLNRSFMNEKNNDCLTGLILCPMDRSTIFFGKAATNFILMTLMEVIILPLFFILFNYKSGGSNLLLILVIFLGTLGFANIGTFLAALTSNTRTSEILLPVILFPLLIPLIIGAVQASGAILTGAENSEIVPWLKIIGTYNLIFLVIPFILFDYVLEV